VIGYAMAEHMRTDLVSGALEMAARSYQRAGDGRAQLPARRRLHYAFRPRQPNICLPNIPARSPGSGCGNRWAHRDMLG